MLSIIERNHAVPDGAPRVDARRDLAQDMADGGGRGAQTLRHAAVMSAEHYSPRFHSGSPLPISEVGRLLSSAGQMTPPRTLSMR